MVKKRRVSKAASQKAKRVARATMAAAEVLGSYDAARTYSSPQRDECPPTATTRRRHFGQRALGLPGDGGRNVTGSSPRHHRHPLAPLPVQGPQHTPCLS